MIYLDAIWGCRRTARINGKLHWIPFGIDLDSNLIDFVAKWIGLSGPSWTAKKLKDLTLWAIQLLSGNRDYSVPWFTKIRYKGYLIPKLKIFKVLIDNLNHPTVVRLILTALKSYRLRTWGTPTLDSIDKVHKVPDTSRYVQHLRRYCHLPRVPDSVLETTEAVATTKAYADDQGVTRPGPYGLLDDDFPAEIRFLYDDLNREPLVLGKLVPIPDKGKWRVILVGHWAVQLQTKRLADWLRKWLWNQPEIASEDQGRMSRFAISSLQGGRHMLSIDLSQATDRLSADFQRKLLVSMGVPDAYFDFLTLPALFRPKEFGRDDRGRLEEIRYVNGQPMGLFLSFPMFELMHYVILKFVTATTDADFRICGDDVMISCRKCDALELQKRYTNLVTRFGGVISPEKTVASDRLAEGVGAIFLKGYSKELRIPSGKLSPLEASSPGFWLNQAIRDESPIGRAIHYSWLSTKEYVEYTYQNRRALNERLVLTDLEEWAERAVRALAAHEDYPQQWYSWEPAPPGTGMDNPCFPESEALTDLPDPYRSEEVFRWVPRRKYRDALVSHKIISLYKKKKEYLYGY